MPAHLKIAQPDQPAQISPIEDIVADLRAGKMALLVAGAAREIKDNKILT